MGDELSIQVEDLNRKLRAEREASASSSGSSGAATSKTLKLEEQLTELEAKLRKSQAQSMDLQRQLENAETGRRGGNEDTGAQKELEIKMRAAVERAQRAEERAAELEAGKRKLAENVDKLENDLLATRNKLTNSLAGGANDDKSKALLEQLKEAELKLDNAELARRGMAQKLQDAQEAEQEARRREAKATEECRKQEEVALKRQGQLQELQRELEKAGSAASTRRTDSNDDTAEKQHREIVGLKNKLQILEEKAVGLDRDLKKTKGERDKLSAQVEEDRRKLSTLRQATESTGSSAGAAHEQVKKLESQVTELEARVKSFQMKASQAEQRADRVESQLATAKKNAESRISVWKRHCATCRLRGPRSARKPSAPTLLRTKCWPSTRS